MRGAGLLRFAALLDSLHVSMDHRVKPGGDEGGRALRQGFSRRRCEERSDEAIQNRAAQLDCFASLAMTRTPHLSPLRGERSEGAKRPRVRGPLRDSERSRLAQTGCGFHREAQPSGEAPSSQPSPRVRGEGADRRCAGREVLRLQLCQLLRGALDGAGEIFRRLRASDDS